MNILPKICRVLLVASVGAAAACGTPAHKASREPANHSGRVTATTSTVKCRPAGNDCRESAWTLMVKDPAGTVRPVPVSERTFKHCPAGASFPSCEGADQR